MFEKLLKRVRLKWMEVRVGIRRELMGAEKPLEYLQFCTQAILSTPEFTLTPISRGVMVYAPQPAKLFTEILAEIVEGLNNDQMVRSVHRLGPFNMKNPLQFLHTDQGCLGQGREHILYHVAAIQAITDYILKGEQETLNNNRYNLRALKAIVPDLQQYVDSVLLLYQSPENR